MKLNIKNIFYKKSKNTKDSTPKQVDGIEVLDLDTDSPKKEDLEAKKENRTILIILASVLVFAALLPTLTGLFKKSSIFSYTNEVNEVVESNTVDGMLEIGKENGSITAKNIQFYNFKKRTNNEISLVYLPSTTIKNVNESNIYIELYDSRKNIIFRTKFTSNSKLERKVPGTYFIPVIEDIYKDAKYGKIVVIKDKEWGSSTIALACTKETENSGYKLTEKVTYNFSKLGLLSYKVSKKITNTTEGEDKNPFKEALEDEKDTIEKTNIKDLDYTDDSLEYTVNLQTLVVNKSSYTPLHSHGSIYRTVKVEETSKSWVCE